MEFERLLADDRAVMPKVLEGCEFGVLPEPGSIVRASRQNGLAIATECRGGDHVRMRHRLADSFVARGVPEPGFAMLLIETGADQNRLAIRAKCHRVDKIGMSQVLDRRF